MAETLALILVFLIIAVGLDGLRRMRSARRSEIKLSRRVKKADQQFGVIGTSEAQDDANIDAGVSKPRVLTRAELSLGSKPAFESEASELHVESIRSVQESISPQVCEPSLASIASDPAVPILIEPEAPVEPADTKAMSDAERQQDAFAELLPDTKSAVAGKNSEKLGDVETIPESRDTLSGGFASQPKSSGAMINADVEETRAACERLGEVGAADSEFDQELDPLFANLVETKTRAEARTEKPSGDCNANLVTSLKASQEDRVVDEADQEIQADTLTSLASRMKNPFKKVVSKSREAFVAETAEVHRTSFAEDDSQDDIDYSDVASPDEMIVLHVMAQHGEVYTGPELLEEFRRCGLRFGEMQIFHAYNDEERSLFSVASAVVPGVFKLNSMDAFTTPGLSFFMGLPNPGPSLQSFDCLIHIAQRIAHNLGGELVDENRNPMRKQTIEHYRQRVSDYERQKRLAHA